SMAEALKADKEFKGKPDDGPLKPMKLLLHSPGKDIYKKNFAWGEAQCSSIVRYFLEGPGAFNEKTKTSLQDYVANLSQLVAAVSILFKDGRSFDVPKLVKGEKAFEAHYVNGVVLIDTRFVKEYFIDDAGGNYQPKDDEEAKKVAQGLVPLDGKWVPKATRDA